MSTTRTFRTARAMLRKSASGHLVALLGAVLITLYGCNGDAVMAPGGGGSGPKTGAGDVIGSTTVTEVGLEWTETNACNGDVVPFHGKVSYGAFTTGSDVYHQRTKFSYVVDGTAAVTGNVYHGASEYDEEWNISTPPMEYTMNHTVTLHSNTAPDWRLHFLAHVTVSATGTTVSFEKGDMSDCDK